MDGKGRPLTRICQVPRSAVSDVRPVTPSPKRSPAGMLTPWGRPPACLPALGRLEACPTKGPAMLPELTPAVSRALDLARALAVREGAAALRPVHLFHGLLAEREGRAGALATAGGLDWEAYGRAAPPAPDAP